MATKYFCAHCDEEFVPEEPADKPRCPRCMRRGGVEPVKAESTDSGTRRPWALIAALVLAAVGIGYAVYRGTTVTLEESPPLRPLETSELRAYLERDAVQTGAYESMWIISGGADGWPESPAELAAKLHGESSRWSLEHPLPRELLGADGVLGMVEAKEERVKLYPLELATTMASLLRARGVKAMLAEAWEIEGAQAPADPSGLLGYFVTAVYESHDADEPSAYFDPWGGRGEVALSSVRVLRDTEALGAALGTEANRNFARTGSGAEALPMSETALLLDPVSPSLRGVHATILLESGGVEQAVKELEAADQLRPDGPRKLSMAQLHLAQAGMLEMNAQAEAAESELNRASGLVGEVIERWPRYGRAHVLLASIYLGSDEPERARIELEAAEALSPDSPLLSSIWAQFLLSTSDVNGAVARMNRAVRLDPDNWQLRLQAARVLQGADDDEGAEENLAAVMRMVAPEKRADVRSFVERMMGAQPLADPRSEPIEEPLGEPAEEAGDGPALMLGDPSNLRLRDPGESLQLDLEE